jgi:2,5-dioxopentanoate dehydrogenase
MNPTTYFNSFNPVSCQAIEELYKNASVNEINEAVKKAADAFAVYRKKDKKSIAAFLEQIATEILSLGNALLERCHQETGLSLPRLEGERARTVNQLRLFATLVQEGSWVDARIDTANPERIPAPKPDIRQMSVPLGPVAIFGASNFPLAFSTAGGDTASALAAGCPVIVKGHEAHPGTSELVAKAISKAIQICNMPEGTFNLLQGNSKTVGETLVKHPGIKAVGFTGSFAGGKALFDFANARKEPIPVFAEMGSTNPVFILPGILKDKEIEIATGMANSIALGVGQFCTKPGIIFVPKSEEANQFYSELTKKINEIPAATMLTPNIKKAFDSGIQKIKNIPELEELASGQAEDAPNSSSPKIFKTSINNFIKNHSLSEENFGPSSIIIESDSKETIFEVARNLEGHLTATVFGNANDLAEYGDLLTILELKVGRIVINGFPTGVEVCHSMLHGGPYPTTTAPQFTSVGSGAIKRFVRPVCFQDYPDSLLPAALKNENPLNIWRLINGSLTQSKIK